MQPHILPSEEIAGIYRFAVLLAGAPGPAQAAVLEVFADAGEKIHHFRSGKSCQAWLVTKIRSRLMKKTAETVGEAAQEKTDNVPSTTENSLDPAALELAARFAKIPEPGRSALALLYLKLFSIQEIAQILQISIDELPEAVESARALLRQLETVQQAPSVPAGGEA